MRFGGAVADIVRDCTDTSPETKPGEKEPWLLRKTRYLNSLARKPLSSLLVTAADKAHNAGDMVLDARRDPAVAQVQCRPRWKRLVPAADAPAAGASPPESRSVERLSVKPNDILHSNAYRS